MNDYTLALFAHILGALALFIGVGLEWTTLQRLRRAETMAQVREWIVLLRGVPMRLPPIGLLLILAAGVYMAATAWDWNAPWILAALAAFVLIGVLGGGVIDRRLVAIREAARATAALGEIPPELERRITDPVLWTALQTAGFTAVGVVFLMTNKPGALGSLTTLALATVLGVVTARPWRRPHKDGASLERATSRVS
jgi:uncharacterized membrane protein